MSFTSDEMEVGLLYTIVQAMYEEAGDGTGTKFYYNEPMSLTIILILNSFLLSSEVDSTHTRFILLVIVFLGRSNYSLEVKRVTFMKNPGTPTLSSIPSSPFLTCLAENSMELCRACW